MSVSIDIAEAVLTELNAGQFSHQFTAVRAATMMYELKDMTDLHVTVIPRSIENTTSSRAKRQRDVAIDVVVQQKLAEGDNNEIDPLIGLAEEIEDFFALRRLDAVAAVCIDGVVDPLYLSKHLDDLRQFTSVVRLTFRTWR